jgi:FKBP-type peptidyl-prolyl cis-trans isomerase FkpA
MKRNHTFLLLTTVAILVIAFSSFTGNPKEKFPGYTEMNSGTYFLLHKKGAGLNAADTGGAVFVKVKFKTISDSVFMDINQLTHNPSYPMRVDPPSFKGDFLDMMSHLHVGDSASFFVRMDSLKKYYPEEFKFDTEYDTMQYLGFVFSVDSIYSRDKVEKLRADAAQAQIVKEELAKKQQEEEPAVLKKYIADNKIRTKPTPDGMYYINIQKGKGQNIMDGDTVKVWYTGKFLDGEIFDSSDKTGQPLIFVIGNHEVITGFEEGLKMMKKGGKATFIIPSALAYGEGMGRLRPYATLIFDVEVLEIGAPEMHSINK